MAVGIEDEFDDELARELALLSKNQSAPSPNTSVAAKPFCYLGTSERMTLLVIVLLGAFLVPFVWSHAAGLVLTLLTIIFRIFMSSSGIVLATLGWGLLLYPVIIAIAFFNLLHWLNAFAQANKIELYDDGILVRWPWNASKKLEWTDITSVFLFRPLETMLPKKWLVGFGASAARPVNIKLNVVAERGTELIALMKEHCRWASIDPDLIELWEPAIADSHTELWLKSLSKAPKEQELMPLFPGVSLKEGRYLILNRIGVGGQGTAYLVKDQLTEKDVVVKENLFPVFVDPEVKATAESRFRREVEILSKLNHERVVRLIDSFVDEHRGYLVLDYIDGVSLRQLVKTEGARTEKEVVSLAMQMAEILAYLHELSPAVVHRDFTPDNLMLDKTGKLVLIDFNVARELESTKTATVVGKHAYIPPEQFRAETDSRSDIYAFGATIYFLLTGADPEPISQSHPRNVLATVSEKLDEIVAKATSQEADDRYQDAKSLMEELRLMI